MKKKKNREQMYTPEALAEMRKGQYQNWRGMIFPASALQSHISMTLHNYWNTPRPQQAA